VKDLFRFLHNALILRVELLAFLFSFVLLLIQRGNETDQLLRIVALQDVPVILPALPVIADPDIFLPGNILDQALDFPGRQQAAQLVVLFRCRDINRHALVVCRFQHIILLSSGTQIILPDGFHAADAACPVHDAVIDFQHFSLTFVFILSSSLTNCMRLNFIFL